MSNSRATDAIPLTGADCFLRAFDAEVRRFNRSSHLSQIVLRLGSGLDPETLRKQIVEAARANPILRAPIRRRHGVGAPAYRIAGTGGLAPPTLAVHEAPAPTQDPPPIPPTPSGVPPPPPPPQAARTRLIEAVRIISHNAFLLVFKVCPPFFLQVCVSRVSPNPLTPQEKQALCHDKATLGCRKGQG